MTKNNDSILVAEQSAGAVVAAELPSPNHLQQRRHFRSLV